MARFRGKDGAVTVYVNGEKWDFTTRYKTVDDGFAVEILRRHPMVEEEA